MTSLIEDLVAVAELPSEKLKKLGDIASENKSISVEWALYIESLDESEKEPSMALFRLLNYIGDAFAETRDFEKESNELDEFIQKITISSKEAKQGWENIKSSFSELNSFFLLKKEEAVKSRFAKVENLSITVDSRPLFSMDREEIEKFLFPCILKVSTADEKTFLCELYPEQIELLEEEIRIAKKKQEILKERMKA